MIAPRNGDYPVYRHRPPVIPPLAYRSRLGCTMRLADAMAPADWWPAMAHMVNRITDLLREGGANLATAQWQVRSTEWGTELSVEAEEGS